jgi:hypothetical protein
MQLVRPAEVHLAAQGRLVTSTAQIMGEGGNLGRELGSVVVRADPGGQLPGHEGKPGRRTQWAIAVEGIEYNPLLRQHIDVRRSRYLSTVSLQGSRR